MKHRKSPHPPYTNTFRDRHGKRHSYFRRGSVRIKLSGPLFSDAWWSEYRQHYADYEAGRQTCLRPAPGAKIKSGSVADAFARYVNSGAFAVKDRFAASTQAAHRRILQHCVDQCGDRPIANLRSKDVARWLDQKATTPAAAREFLKAMRRWMQYLVNVEKMIAEDPTAGIKASKPKEYDPEDGIHCVSDDEIEIFRRHYPDIGSLQRQEFELLLGTAQRCSDVVRLGRMHLSNGIIRIRQQKTRSLAVIPVGPELAAVIATVPTTKLTFLETVYGKARTADGLSADMRKWFDAAGLPQCSAHGLRKAWVRRAVESGKWPLHAMMAVTGHKTLRELQRYAEAFSRERVVLAAMADSGTPTDKPEIRFVNGRS
jgi:site-specific recombinase XerD